MIRLTDAQYLIVLKVLFHLLGLAPILVGAIELGKATTRKEWSVAIGWMIFIASGFVWYQVMIFLYQYIAGIK